MSNFKVHGMHCKSCAKKIEDALSQVPGVISININLDDDEVTLEADEYVTLEVLNAALQEEGAYKLTEKHKAQRPEIEPAQYELLNFMPLIVIFTIIFFITILLQLYRGWDVYSAMSDFMGVFFLVFGTFKIINWKGFADAYTIYDIIAQQIKPYAYAYPLIELAFGVAYITQWNPFVTNLVTFILMTISSIGVFIELRKKTPIVCACLGAVFKIPMTYVTLAEDLLMAAMALFMLLMS